MAKFKDYEFLLQHSISGIPCQLAVTYCLVVPPWRGSAMNCPSDLDYYGYDEVEYVVLDRKGYVADWLAKKMTDRDNDEAESEILSYYKRKQEEDYYY